MPKGPRERKALVESHHAEEASLLPKAQPKALVREPDGVKPQTSPLKTYFHVSGMTPSSFAIAMGVPLQSVRGWETGVMPTLPAAYEIERLTKGAVPMEAWLALPSAKEMLRGWRTSQREEVAGNRSDTEPGGFAQGRRKS